MSVRIDKVVTSGTFSLDGETFEVDNNTWIVGDDEECVVIDAGHDPAKVASTVGARRTVAVLCTHAHDDHVRQAPELGRLLDAPVLLHPADVVVWKLTHDDAPDGPIADRQRIRVAGAELRVVHTPGHSPGSVCFYVPSEGVLFTGDTLFSGGPGATGRSFSDADQIKESIRTRLLSLPDETVVHTGHGEDTTVAAEMEGSIGWE